MKTETYSVDEKRFATFLKKVSKRRTIFSLTVIIVVIGMFVIIMPKIERNFPIFLFIIIVGIILFGALWLGQKNWTNTLLKFQDAKFEISQTEITLLSSSLTSRSIPFDQIAVIDKTFKGTVLVKGNSWTKINYYQPKKIGIPLESIDRIFIPSVTQNYEELIEKVKRQAKKNRKFILR